jgi:hypothetical protein
LLLLFLSFVAFVAIGLTDQISIFLQLRNSYVSFYIDKRLRRTSAISIPELAKTTPVTPPTGRVGKKASLEAVRTPLSVYSFHLHKPNVSLGKPFMIYKRFILRSI